MVKCRGHTNFDRSKIYEANLEFGTFKVINVSRDLVSRKREKSMV